MPNWLSMTSALIACFFLQTFKTDPSNRVLVLRHVESDYSEGTVKFSEFAPFMQDPNYMYSYHSSCQLGNNTLVVIVERQSKPHGLDSLN
jgi:hypothetical protein